MGHVCTRKMQVIHPSNERQCDPGKEHGAPFPKVFYYGKQVIFEICSSHSGRFAGNVSLLKALRSPAVNKTA